MRLSSTQKAVLVTLYGIAIRRTKVTPVPSVDLLNIINKYRAKAIADTNFRTSCHTLEKNGLLEKYRDLTSLRLSFALTPAGAQTASQLYQALNAAADPS